MLCILLRVPSNVTTNRIAFSEVKKNKASTLETESLYLKEDPGVKNQKSFIETLFTYFEKILPWDMLLYLRCGV